MPKKPASKEASPLHDALPLKAPGPLKDALPVKEKLPWWDRLNRLLMPYIGPPALGPYDEPPLAPTGPKPCPVCGERMDEHEIERGEGRTATRIICPTVRERSRTTL